ncbi:kynurenine formamidase [Phlebotomus argentipes]|uniref:kynurenine formamidase n=1 Tax=Phlebotomus argentipes TaxID=94469 RepID=UPI00289356BB|nr:kynurenine formamidase [Phlebotomus argentipes]
MTLRMCVHFVHIQQYSFHGPYQKTSLTRNPKSASQFNFSTFALNLVTMSDAQRDLEKEFSPSAWVKRFRTAEEVIEHHKKVVREGTQLARETFKCELDVAYGPGERSKVDIYGTDLPPNAPILVLVHGGYWQLEEYTKELGTYGVLPLVPAGCRVIAADYEMCPKVTLSELTENAFQCLSFCLNYAAKLGASSVSFLGHSAGAHLVVAQFEQERFERLPHKELIRDVYLLSGVFDLRELRHTEAANSKNLLAITDDNVTALSPALASFLHLGTESVNFTIVVTGNESQSYLKMSEDMRDALHGGTNLVRFYLLPNKDHFDIVEQLNDKEEYLTEILLEDLKN